MKKHFPGLLSVGGFHKGVEPLRVQSPNHLFSHRDNIVHDQDFGVFRKHRPQLLFLCIPASHRRNGQVRLGKSSGFLEGQRAVSRKEPNFKKSFLQKVIRDLREVPVLPRKILVAVSGGADSVGLLLALSEIQKLFRFQLTVGHVHHGISKDHRQNEFRNQAQQLAKELADSKGFQFLSNEPLETHLKSEADFRTYRYTWLIQWQEQHQLEAIALGHHFEDLLETQMMRLARGSARLGLGAMVPLSPQKRLRPFLNLKKAEVVQFVESMGEKWLEDPSNDQGENLRVQMRQWLEDLEGFCPGGKENLSKSFQRMAQMALEERHPWKKDVMTKGGIRREIYLGLSLPRKMELLVDYIRTHGVASYTSGQIKELVKRLDGPEKKARFKFLDREWALQPDLIKIVYDI
ncbi:MAG TPA: tRNA lysidine(34) synthetase TilS [Bdellovibrionales bacterium]|nr:tRNA lysidine(34) synthetase TilS [Pseudobdellovibrionaceae bacterium]HAG91016.1 tRNA lysidine(34) synthetase TilS [Bdellovibrionales bacterium]